jgi:hypothetical protein
MTVVGDPKHPSWPYIKAARAIWGPHAGAYEWSVLAHVLPAAGFAAPRPRRLLRVHQAALTIRASQARRMPIVFGVKTHEPC